MVSNLVLLASLYWGVHNQGEPQRITIDHFTSGYVMGVKGEDIRLPAPLLGSKKISQKIIVAVLDTGIDATNPALKNVIAGKGYNFVDNNDNTTDNHGHGTHVSGIIATQVTQNALILPVKVVQTGPNAPIRPQDVEAGAGTALTENVAKGVVYAVKNGAKVINLSLAWPISIHSKTMDDAMALADQNGVLVVGSAANDGTSANLYPCIYSNSICVGAHGPDGAYTYFSNYGSLVDILAPGIAILSTWPMNKAPVTFAGQIGYEFRNGTSMAAPFVAGAAAELFSRGFSATEVKSRLLLGARLTQDASLYSTAVVGNYSADEKKEKKFSRFGNLDITHALEIAPQALVLPTKKARNEIIWNGSDKTVVSTVEWKNNWKAATSVKITVNGQSFRFGNIQENQILDTPIQIKLDNATESTFDQIANVETIELNGTKNIRTIPISFTVNRLITISTLPSDSLRYPFQTIDPHHYTSIRSVVNADHSSERELFFVNKDELVLTRKGVVLGKASFPDVPEDKILNLYRLDENTYSLIGTDQKKGETRPSFLIKMLDSKLQLRSESKLGTDITVLNENFVWKKSSLGQSLMWISIGYSPPAEKPAFDPWNADAVDPKMPRIYYTEGKDLHTIVLKDDEMPLQILPTGDVLIAKGNGYSAQYFLLSIDLTQKEKIASRKEISLDSYRMLIGVDGNNLVLSLKGSLPDSILMVGPSTPGNLRASTINASTATSGIDTILKRESSLDALIQVSGAFSDLDQQYLFVQTHYDMKFFRSQASSTKSVSLNRYSYIPSMIFSRNFFPVVARDQFGNGVPAIYIPASIANADVSELIVASTKTGDIKKPAAFHFQAGPDCMALGNLVPASETDTAKEVFVCGNEVVLIPLRVSE